MPITHAAKHRKWGKLGNEKAEQVKARFLDGLTAIKFRSKEKESEEYSCRRFNY